MEKLKGEGWYIEIFFVNSMGFKDKYPCATLNFEDGEAISDALKEALWDLHLDITADMTEDDIEQRKKAYEWLLAKYN